MRKVSIDGAMLPSLKENELLSKSYEFKLISPMFGGDTESFVINKKVPIRAQSIKGQLRFWWRTMQGESNSKRLLERESDFWGSATLKKKQSHIKISVTGIKDLAFVKVEKKLSKSGSFAGIVSNDIAPYVLFPVTKKIKDDEIVDLLQQATFTLNITFPRECEKDAMNALLLWSLFGGVGGRTRRGCGSVYSQELLKDMQIDSLPKVKSFMESIAQGNSTELEYARLKGFKLFCNPSAKNSVNKLQEKYGTYRQDRKPDPEENDFRSHPGRSYWPEPDAIRLLSGKWSEKHAPRHPDANQREKVWFPRAAFGLPIMTRFNTQNNGIGDPSDNWKLEPQNAERWPSTYFIKLLCINDCYYDVLLVLNQKFPSSLELVQTLDRGGKVKSIPIPSSAMPSNTQGKIMVKDPRNSSLELRGRTIYEALAGALNLKEVK